MDHIAEHPAVCLFRFDSLSLAEVGVRLFSEGCQKWTKNDPFLFVGCNALGGSSLGRQRWSAGATRTCRAGRGSGGDYSSGRRADLATRPARLRLIFLG